METNDTTPQGIVPCTELVAAVSRPWLVDMRVEQWVCSPMLRWKCGVLQQLWTETWSGGQDWRDVPSDGEKAATEALCESAREKGKP